MSIKNIIYLQPTTLAATSNSFQLSNNNLTITVAGLQGSEVASLQTLDPISGNWNDYYIDSTLQKFTSLITQISLSNTSGTFRVKKPTTVNTVGVVISEFVLDKQIINNALNGQYPGAVSLEVSSNGSIVTTKPSSFNSATGKLTAYLTAPTGEGSSSVIQKDSLLDFPIVGNPSVLYIALNSNIMYFWDIDTNTYVPISGGANKNLRGGYNASSNEYPSTGGSGIAGAIMAADYWYVTVPGVLNGEPVVIGSTITALIDNPEQTPSNWLIIVDSVISVFGRIGAITAQSGDYNINQITNGLSNALLENNIFVGDALNKASNVLPNNAFNKTFETLNIEIKMDGVASVGTSSNIPRSDHIHPSDTSKQNALTNPVTSLTAFGGANQLAVFNGTNDQVTPTTTLPTAAVPAFIGDVTNSAGSLNTIINNNVVTNAKLNTMAANTIKMNATGSTANAQDVATNTAFNKNFETSTANIKMDGVASVGSSGNAVNSDHIHSSDTSKQNIISTPTANNLVGVNNLGQVIDSGLSVSTISSTSSDTTLLTSKAIQTAIVSAIIGSENLRGGYNASNNVFPSTGGTGTGNAINAGDYWYITVVGTLGGEFVPVGSSVTALVNNPGQTPSNWLIIQDAVNSVFGRTGLITAQTGDYTISQITNGLSNVLSSANIFVGNASNISISVPMSADATISNTGAVTIVNNAVTNTKLNIMATNTLKGNNTAATANPIDLTSTQVTQMLNTVVGDTGLGGTKGLAPAPAAGDAAAGKFLKADGTYAVPTGSGGTTVGDTKTSLQAADHSNWLLWTNGRILSRITNATLWNFVNTNSLIATGLFGAGDGVATFTMGNINGRAIGITGSGTGLTVRTLGASVGTEEHILTVAQMPAHGHTGTTNTGLATGTVPYTTDEGGNTPNNVVLSGNTVINSAILAHTHTVTVTNTGGGLSHPIVQPTIFLNFFVFSG